MYSWPLLRLMSAYPEACWIWNLVLPLGLFSIIPWGLQGSIQSGQVGPDYPWDRKPSDRISWDLLNLGTAQPLTRFPEICSAGDPLFLWPRLCSAFMGCFACESAFLEIQWVCGAGAMFVDYPALCLLIIYGCLIVCMFEFWKFVAWLSNVPFCTIWSACGDIKKTLLDTIIVLLKEDLRVVKSAWILLNFQRPLRPLLGLAGSRAYSLSLHGALITWSTDLSCSPLNAQISWISLSLHDAYLAWALLFVAMPVFYLTRFVSPDQHIKARSLLSWHQKLLGLLQARFLPYYLVISL